MTAIGKYNVSTNTENTLFVVGDGIGVASVNRSDAFRVVNGGLATASPTIPSSVQAKVNGVPDVYLGCPIGTIVMWAGETAPKGWLLCDGQSIASEAQYSQLRSALGGSTNVPNFKGLFPVGAGKGTDKNTNTHEFTLGDYTYEYHGPGEYKHKLTKEEMPSHQHSI
jgi:hypothetical protein